MGLLAFKLTALAKPYASLNRVFNCFAFAATPTYILSILWYHIPAWLYVIALTGVAIQLWGWTIFWRYLIRHKDKWKSGLSAFSRTLLLLAGLAATIKLLLQATSVIPSISKLAFGFRPIVIGYLHLILLGMITLFIIGYSYLNGSIHNRRPVKTGIRIFVAGILTNELLLMSQGVSDILYLSVSHINTLLLVAALILFSGAVTIVAGQFLRKDDLGHKINRTADRNLEKINYG
jgi:hypothetical protein